MVKSAAIHKEEMNPHEKGIVSSVMWAKNNAVPAYAEKMVNLKALQLLSKQIKAEKNLLIDLEFTLLAWALVQYVKSHLELNAYYDNNAIIKYDEINLGFTIDVDGDLYIAVLRNSEKMNREFFIEQFFSIQRKAMKKDLSISELSGYTIGITSLAAFGVTKHIPILPPHTSIMVAHSAKLPNFLNDADWSNIGVTYDHRIHTGTRIAALLKGLNRMIQ